MPQKPLAIGGQAVMEGVMMRGSEQISIAVRQPDGQVSLTVKDNWRIAKRFPFLKLPLLRGVAAFIEALVIGVDAIMISAEQSQTEEVQLTKKEAIFSVVLGLSLGVGLFMLLPTFLMRLTSQTASALQLNLMEGGVRLAIFLTYVLLIGLWPDMRRFYQYHGAEHKVIATLEAGEAISVEAARKYSCLHPRCGTAFLLLVMLVSILAFSFFGWPSLLGRLALRLALLPLIAGIAYEVSRLAASDKGQRYLWWLLAPALALQRATTREPDDAQIEIAIAALQGLSDSELGLQ